MLVLLFGVKVFAEDVVIDGNGNLQIGTLNNYGNLKVTGASGEHGVVGETSGTGAAGVYGKTGPNIYDDYGTLGEYDGINYYGVHGKSSTGLAGFFEGNASVTGNLTVYGTITGETDPSVNASVKDGVDWTEIMSIPAGFADGIDNADGSGIWNQNAADIYFNSGNVGIGTIAPAGKLDVNGDICLGSVCRTTWPSGAGTGAFTDTGTTAYYNGGNVGIGTNSPVPLVNTDTRVLHIRQPVALLDNASAAVRLEIEGIVNGGITSAYNKVSGEGGIFVGTLSNHRVGFIANSMEKMTLAPDGHFGIDTTSPLQPLHVQGSAYISENLGIGISSPTNRLQVSGTDALLSSGTGDFRLKISKNSVSNTSSLIFQDNFSGRAEVGLAGDDDFHIKVSADGTSFIDAIVIGNSGNVGIGEQGSGAKFKVLKTTPNSYAIFAESLGDNANAIGVEKDGIGSAVYIYKKAGESGNSIEIDHYSSDNALVIRSGVSEILVVESTGDVAIGSASATAKLDLNGPTGYNQLRVRTPYTPTSTNDPNGNIGDIAWDDNYMYIKTNAGWKRSQLSTW
jgi:hypothetical protein